MIDPNLPASEQPVVELPEEDQESVTDWGRLDTPSEDLLTPDTDELDRLLADSQPAAAAPADPLDELDALLGESMAIKRTNDAAKAAKERMKRGGMSEQERRETEALIRQWELAHEWKAEANVALFNMDKCLCGQSHVTFNRLLTRLRHRHLVHSAMRWLPAEHAQAALPNETVFQVTKVPLCIACCDSKGWSTVNPVIWKGNGE